MTLLKAIQGYKIALWKICKIQFRTMSPPKNPIGLTIMQMIMIEKISKNVNSIPMWIWYRILILMMMLTFTFDLGQEDKQ